MNKQFFDKKLGDIPDEVLQNALKRANMNNQLEAAAETAILKATQNGEWTLGNKDIVKTAMFNFVNSDAAKEFHTQEARELIEELRDKLKKMSVRSFSPSLNEILALATKAEQFLNK